MKSVCLALVLLLLPACVCGRFWSSPWPSESEAHEVVTADGWHLELHHRKPIGEQRHARPVVVLHGIVTNGRNCDLDDDHSIARALARRGFDVWVPSLRNTGLSEHRALFSVADAESNFDAYVQRDLPAVLDYVRAHTGAKEVDFIGHSMGGMILYAYLSSGGQGIHRAVTLGSPVRMRWGGHVQGAMESVGGAASVANWMPIRAVALTTLPLAGSVKGPVELTLMNPENTDPDVWRRFLSVGVDDLPSALMVQFADWAKRDAFDSADHKIDYLGGLANVHVPLFVFAAKVDGIAPPWVVKPAFERLGSAEKSWLVLGEANGQKADYNHMDMLLGERADAEVFEPAARFLARE